MILDIVCECLNDYQEQFEKYLTCYIWKSVKISAF